jgi:pimeloyl-ACP methyl ester carboxylesterase
VTQCTQTFSCADGTRIAYELRGNLGADRAGDIVVFNGLFAGLSTWSSLYRHNGLTRRHRLVFFDYPCQGLSDAFAEPFRVQRLLDACVELLQFLQVQKPLFVGHSLGGMLATMLASRGAELSPSPAAGLLVVNSGTYMPRSSVLLFDLCRQFLGRERGFVRAPDAENEAEPAAEVFRFLVPQVFGEAFLQRSRGLETDIIRSYAEYNRDVRAVARLLDACMGRSNELGDIASYMRRVEVPVRVVLGAEDKIFPVELGVDLAAAAKRGRCEVLSQVGHSCMVEAGREFAAKLADFARELFEPSSAAEPLPRRSASTHDVASVGAV